MASNLEHLKDILTRNGVVHLPDSLPRLTMPKLRQSKYYEDIKETYEELGGQKVDTPFGLNDFFLEMHNKAVIIDDKLHFNQYRSKTMLCPIYDELLNFPLQNYRRYSRQFQKECLMAGSRNELWSDPLSDRHFGASNDSGDLGLNGSSTWKMNAMIDLITDTSTLLMPYEVIRISLYDSVLVGGKITPLKDLLLSRKEENEQVIYMLFARKLGLIKKDIKQFMNEELNNMDDKGL